MSDVEHSRWRFVVVDSFTIAGHGVVYTGTLDSEAEPALGDVKINGVPGRSARSFEKYAIPNWWRTGKVGLLLSAGNTLLPGDVIEGCCR